MLRQAPRKSRLDLQQWQVRVLRLGIDSAVCSVAICKTSNDYNKNLSE